MLIMSYHVLGRHRYNCEGDIYLLCSDGLCDMVGDEDIGEAQRVGDRHEFERIKIHRLEEQGIDRQRARMAHHQRVAIGFAGLVDGPLDALGARDAALMRAREEGYQGA